MTLYQFLGSDEAEQMEAIWDNGVHIAERDDEVYRYILYSIGSFYVELKYHREYNVLHGSRAFTTEKLLEPYLPFINISEIRNL